LEELRERHEPDLESILFDGEGTARTFDEFREGLERRYDEKEAGWVSPAIKESLDRNKGLVRKRGELIQEMRARRGFNLLEVMGGPGARKVVEGGKVDGAVCAALDNIYSDTWSTVAFQTALVCTFTEMVERRGLGDAEVDGALCSYIENLNRLFCPRTVSDLKRLFEVFEGRLELDPTRVIPGGATFRAVVLSGEMQPAEWPKYRYLILELWRSNDPALEDMLQEDRLRCREAVGKGLLIRRVRAYCDDNALAVAELSKSKLEEITDRARSDYEHFLANVAGTSVSIPRAMFDGLVSVGDVAN